MDVKSNQTTKVGREGPEYIFPTDVPQSIRNFANILRWHEAITASDGMGPRTDRSADIESAARKLTKHHHGVVAVERVVLQAAGAGYDWEMARGYIVKVKKIGVGG